MAGTVLVTGLKGLSESEIIRSVDAQMVSANGVAWGDEPVLKRSRCWSAPQGRDYIEIDLYWDDNSNALRKFPIVNGLVRVDYRKQAG